MSDLPLYDDKRLYTVKETARITGVSEKSLRYYDDEGLLKPFRRGGDNNYRYYTINQFYVLELFKIAKRLGLSVPQYKSLLITHADVASGEMAHVRETIDDLLGMRRAQLAELSAVVEELERMRENLDVLEANRIDGEPFVQELPRRCVYAIDHDPNVPFEQTSVRMRTTRGMHAGHLTEQYGLLLDVDAARRGEQRILRQFVVLACDLEDSDEIMHLPAGRYTSFLYHVMRPSEPLTSLSAWLAENPVDVPYLVADELGCFEAVPEIVHALRVPPRA